MPGKKDKKKSKGKNAEVGVAGVDDALRNMSQTTISATDNPLGGKLPAVGEGIGYDERMDAAFGGLEGLDALNALSVPDAIPMVNKTLTSTMSMSFEQEYGSAEDVDADAVIGAPASAPHYRQLKLVNVPMLGNKAGQHKTMKGAIEAMSKTHTHAHHLVKKEEKKDPRTPRDHDDDERIPVYIMNPESSFMTIWKTLQAFIVFWIYIELPFRIAFIPGKQIALLNVVNFVFDILLFADFILGFFTAYHYVDRDTQSRRLETKMGSIRCHYLGTTFFINLFTCFPFDTTVRVLAWAGVWDGTAHHVVTLGTNTTNGTDVTSLSDEQKIVVVSTYMRAMRMMRFGKLGVCFTEIGRVFGKLPAVWSGFAVLLSFSSALSIVAATAFFNHLVACFLFFAGTFNDEGCEGRDSCGWVWKHEGITAANLECVRTGEGCVPDGLRDPDGTNGATLSKLYTSAYYYGFTIIATVGFGDISASSELERVVTTLTMMCGCLVFGVILAKIGIMVTEREASALQFKGQMSEYIGYMSATNAGFSLRRQVTAYFEQAFPLRHIYEEKLLLSRLPLGLRCELVAERFLPILRNAPFLSAELPFMNAVMQRLMSRTALAGETILNEGATAQEIFFIASGQVWACIEGKEGPVSVMTDRDFFGEIAVILNCRRKATVVAAKLTYLTTLNVSDFRGLQEDFGSFRAAVERYKADCLPDFVMHEKAHKHNHHSKRPDHLRHHKKGESVTQLDRLEEHLYRLDDKLTDMDDRTRKDIRALTRDLNVVYRCVNNSLA